jgi:predicted transcriptional regulator of viral defense system
MHDAVAAGPDAAGLFLLATEQGGYFTSAQAHAYGYNKQLLAHHAATGRFQRRRRGLYRLRDYPPSPREDVMAAWLAAGKDHAVVSHESALDLLGLSDVVPSSIHLLVPRARRWFHAPPGVTLHTTTHPVSAGHAVVRQGMCVTSPLRTLLDVAEAGTAPEQIILAVRQARERGMLLAPQLRQAAQQRDQRVQKLIDQALCEGS